MTNPSRRTRRNQASPVALLRLPIAATAMAITVSLTFSVAPTSAAPTAQTSACTPGPSLPAFGTLHSRGMTCFEARTVVKTWQRLGASDRRVFGLKCRAVKKSQFTVRARCASPAAGVWWESSS